MLETRDLENLRKIPIIEQYVNSVCPSNSHETGKNRKYHQLLRVAKACSGELLVSKTIKRMNNNSFEIFETFPGRTV